MQSRESAGLQSQSSAGGGETWAPTYLHREYVWGPGDRGIDELLAVFTGTHPSDGLAPRTPWYAITDTGGDVVGLVEITNPGTTQAQAHVAAQWTYDPYGNVQSADYIRPHPHISVGHKGLFAERLDVPLMYAFGDPAHPTLTPFSRIHYHTRNRVLDPTLGRWLQRDPNATGQAVVASLALQGMQVGSLMSAITLDGHTVDGMNTHQYVRGNPLSGGDPFGLLTNNLRPGQLLGPGWSQGGIIMYNPEQARAAQSGRAMQIGRQMITGALKGAGLQVGIGGVQIAGAGFAHLLYGQTGGDGGDVLGATMHQIWNRTLRQAGEGAIGGGFPRGIGDLGLAVAEAIDGNYIKSVLNIASGLKELAGGVAKSAAFAIAAPGVVGAGVYSGIQEYMINDIYNWGFGVRGEDLYGLWNDWE